MENNVGDGESGRRRFIRRLTTLGAAGGIATLLYGRVTEKPLIQLAQAASGQSVLIDETNTGTGTTELDSSATSGYAFGVIATAGSGRNEGIRGQTNSWNGTGVSGMASAGSGQSCGVYGESRSDNGIGLFGYVGSTSGPNYGLYARSMGINGRGVWGEASATSGYNYGVTGVSNSPNGICVQGIAGAAGTISMVAQGASGQTANLQEWRAQSAAALAVVDKDGRHGIGTSAPAAAVQVVRPASWTNADPLVRLDGDTYNVGAFFYAYGAGNFPFFSGRRSRGSQSSPSAVQSGDLLMRYGGAGYGTNAFPSGNRAMIDFYAAENWTNTTQGTYVTISTTTTGASTPSEKMRVTGDGSILPPSDNVGSIGKVGQRWNLVRAQTITSGDLTFENGYRVTEDPNSGLLFVNQKGEQIAKLDEQGNFRIKGRVIEGL